MKKKKKTYRKDYYPDYNKLLCRTTGCVPTGKGFNLPTERPPPLALLQVGWMTEVTCSSYPNVGLIDMAFLQMAVRR
ncbi:hypothetical protein AYI68_g1473 [Smittium mucronatum]|uniref:Uncharacterized protein n=1 Tax=Smittium mucronatum TaxID=133383 RepID=A0A1R0H556_9FUNG|nr:hypothetical protein AYI68_g1473 [Smittium mucronatum]